MTILFGDEAQWEKYKQYNPDVSDPRPIRLAAPRDIFEIAKDGNGYSYKGVKKLKS